MKSVLWTAAISWCTERPTQVLIIPDSFTRALWLQQRYPVAKQGVGEECLSILPTKYLCHTPQGSLTCRKILRHGADGFISAVDKVVLRILSPFQIHHSRPGLNSRTLGPMASTIAITQQRMIIKYLVMPIFLSYFWPYFSLFKN
jgi:hypothetical protein